MESSSAQIDSEQIHSYLECPICMSIVCEPISIGCGHTFCRVCLVVSLKKHKKKCSIWLVNSN